MITLEQGTWADEAFLLPLEPRLTGRSPAASSIPKRSHRPSHREAPGALTWQSWRSRAARLHEGLQRSWPVRRGALQIEGSTPQWSLSPEPQPSVRPHRHRSPVGAWGGGGDGGLESRTLIVI